MLAPAAAERFHVDLSWFGHSGDIQLFNVYLNIGRVLEIAEGERSARNRISKKLC